MANVLLCVWDVPDSLRFYALDNLTAEEVKVVRLVHNRFANTAKLKPAVEAAVYSVLAAVDKEKKNWDGANVLPGWLEKDWYKRLIETKHPPQLKARRLVITGCYM
jgi:hypothetical protein